MPSTLIHGDCLRLMPMLQEKSADLVLTDLPYGVTQNHWDSVIPLEILWKEWLRIAKPDCTFILFVQEMSVFKAVDRIRPRLKQMSYEYVR